MAKPKQYKVVAEPGVVGFKGVIHKQGDVINAGEVPAANLNAWLRFGQVEEVTEEQSKPSGGSAAPSGEGENKKAPKK